MIRFTLLIVLQLALLTGLTYLYRLTGHTVYQPRAVLCLVAVYAACAAMLAQISCVRLFR